MSTSEASSSPLPPLYDRWMQEFLAAPIASEPEATCDDCAMCKKPGDTSSGLVFFQPEVKCCTYVPSLPNFLVGRILADTETGTEAGRASLGARVAARLRVTPLGVDRTAMDLALYDTGADGGFGKARALRCPHYLEETGLCGIWRHRNHVCTTWFCKHVRGAVGANFWVDVRDLLGAVESTLSKWCVLELGLESTALREISTVAAVEGKKLPLNEKDLDGVPDVAALRRVWGKWYGREKEFYLEAARLVDPLSWDQVMEIGGPDLRLAASLLADAHAKVMSDELPEKLVPASLQATPLAGGLTRIVTYREYDPLSLPNEVLEILPHFDGRTTTEVLESLERDENVAVEKDLLLQLVDFRVLVPPPDPADVHENE